MLSISGKIREEKEKPTDRADYLPGVLYGPKIKNLNIAMSLKDFEKVYEQVGESSLMSLDIKGKNDKFLVLVHEMQRDPVSGKPTHVDFYQPNLKEEVEIEVPIVVEGESPAVKNLGGTLIKNISVIEVKALPQSLPKEIKVNIETLKEIGDHILVGDLPVPEGVKLTRKVDEIAIFVAAPEKVEEELEKPIEEKIEEVGQAKVKKEAEPKEASED